MPITSHHVSIRNDRWERYRAIQVRWKSNLIPSSDTGVIDIGEIDGREDDVLYRPRVTSTVHEREVNARGVSVLN